MEKLAGNTAANWADFFSGAQPDELPVEVFPENWRAFEAFRAASAAGLWRFPPQGGAVLGLDWPQVRAYPMPEMCAADWIRLADIELAAMEFLRETGKHG